jgi:hypothetical protein
MQARSHVFGVCGFSSLNALIQFPVDDSIFFSNLQLASTVNFPTLAGGIKTNCHDPYDIVNKIPTSRGLNHD